MASQVFAAYLDVEQTSKPGHSEAQNVPTAPQKALPRLYHSVPQAPDAFELAQMDPVRYTGTDTASITASDRQAPQDVAEDLEMSRPSTPDLSNVVEVLQSVSNPSLNRFRMLSSCLTVFCYGLNDSAPGPLIPHIEAHYDIGYGIVSLIFVTNAVGWISAAFFVDTLRARLGWARTLMLGNALIICGYIPIICTPPFPVVVASFFPLGLGSAFNLALCNVFVANLQNSTRWLGVMHGSYGIGGTIGPLIATAMVGSTSLVWSRYYTITLSVSILNLMLSGWSFWNYETESSVSSIPAARAPIGRPTIDPPANVTSQLKGMFQAFKSQTVLLGALFIFSYQGAEVSISGWVISFLIKTRGGDPSSVGYVTSGFWLGITLGRFLLSAPAHRMGEKLSVYLMAIGAAAFQLLVWLVPNVIGDAVAVAIVGLLLGPVYPCATVVFSRAISRKLQVSSLSVIMAFGSSGGALAPFTTGILAQAVGTFVLHPIVIGLYGLMVVTWFGIPDVKKRRE